MTLREIIENPNRWGEFLRTIGATSNANRNSENKKHENQKNWDKLLNDYEEYLQDVERAIKVANKREGHYKNTLVRSLTTLDIKRDVNIKINALRKMKYEDFEIDAIMKYALIKKFFEYECEQIKDGKAVVNDRIRELHRRFQAIETYCLSVSTEASDGKNNRKFSRKHSR